MNLLKQYLLVFMSIMLVACASAPTPYKLKSISNVSNNGSSKKEVTAFVELNNDKPNRVAVFNWETYTLFSVYKNTGDNGNFIHYAKLTAGVKPDISAIMTMFDDTKSSSLNDRYEVRPVVDGKELNALPIEYITNDSTYYKRIESKE